MKQQSGSLTLILGLVMIPVLVAIAIMTIGISKYYYQHQTIQQHLDQAVILALKSLPNYMQAEQVVKNYLSSKRISPEQVTLQFYNNRVALKYSSSYTIKFANYFRELEIPLNAFSQGEGELQNIDLILDLASKSNVPKLDYWPVAQYAHEYFDEFELNQYAVNPQELTTKCFNPEFNLMKLIALEILDYYHHGKQGDLILWDGTSGNTPRLNSMQFSELENTSKLCYSLAINEEYFEQYKFPFSVKNSQSDDLDLERTISLSELVWSLAQNSQINFDLSKSLDKVHDNLTINLGKLRHHKIIILSNQIFTDYNTFDLQLSRFANIAQYGIPISLYYLAIKSPPTAQDIEWQELVTRIADKYHPDLVIKPFVINEIEASSYVSNIINEQKDYVLLK